MDHVMLDPIQITENPELAGVFQIWGWSMNCWEIDLFHEPAKETTIQNRSKTWTTIDARKDSIIEYSWWFESYQQMLMDYDAMDIIDCRPPFERKAGDRRQRYYLRREHKESIPITIIPVDGLSNARWTYRTDIEELMNMKDPPSRREWVEEILSFHNHIVETLNVEWDKVKEFY